MTMSDSKDANATATMSLDKPKALALISSFFPEEWSQTDASQINVRKLTHGVVDTVHLVQRDGPANTEPCAVIVWQFGRDGEVQEPPGNFMSLSSTQQAVVGWEMSRQGWGPRIYGFFPGGRVEEYIDSHTLTPIESTQPDIQRDVARSYARLHSLQLPLAKDQASRVYAELRFIAKTKHNEVGEKLRTSIDPVAREYAAVLESTDWVKELEWMWNLFDQHHCKNTITQGDTNHLNVLVKESVSLSECRVVLIDYDCVKYNYRGIDIGGHFRGRMYCLKQPGSKLTGYGEPDLEDKRSFCQAYLQELRERGQTLSEVDTVDHLILEATIGSLYQHLVACLLRSVHPEDDPDPVFLSRLMHTWNTYKQLKLEFGKSLGGSHHATGA